MDYERTMQRYRQQIERTNQKIRQYEAMSIRPKPSSSRVGYLANNSFTPQEVAVFYPRSPLPIVMREQRTITEPNESRKMNTDPSYRVRT